MADIRPELLDEVINTSPWIRTFVLFQFSPAKGCTKASRIEPGNAAKGDMGEDAEEEISKRAACGDQAAASLRLHDGRGNENDFCAGEPGGDSVAEDFVDDGLESESRARARIGETAPFHS